MRRKASEAEQGMPGQPIHRQLILILVAFHPSREEVEALQGSLSQLPASIGYGVVVNDHRPGEPVEALFAQADRHLCNRDNPGYGRAVNRLAGLLPAELPYVAALNTDLTWVPGTFERMLSWLDSHPDVVLAVPKIVDPDGAIQRLCKRDPTVLGLFSRRFLPDWLKPRWLRAYDGWYAMADADYGGVLRVPYLSGCCMVLRHAAFRQVGGFDERFFLYLEDADLTRALRAVGDTVHLPLACVVHAWGRGNHRSWRLTLVNFSSAWLYFWKWGWRWV